MGHFSEKYESWIDNPVIRRYNENMRQKCCKSYIFSDRIKTFGGKAHENNKDFIHHFDSDAKAVFLMVDDLYEEKEGSENTCWLYDADFEYLAQDEVKRVVVAGARNLDHKLRLLMAGVPEDRIVCVLEEKDAVEPLVEAAKELGVDSMFILHEVFGYQRANQVRECVKERLVSCDASN